MVPINILENSLWGPVGSEKEILDSHSMHFLDTVCMHKLQIFKVLKIGVSKSDKRLS